MHCVLEPWQQLRSTLMTKHSWSVEWRIGTSISEELAAFIVRAFNALKTKAAVCFVTLMLTYESTRLFTEEGPL
jgi:hypothetical protein